MKNPFRRRDRVLNPGGDAVLIHDTDELVGDELFDLGDGRTIRVADLMAGGDEITAYRGDPS